MNKVIRMTKNNKGESLAETLVALLIAALGILLLAGMVNASSNLVRSSRQKILEYVGLENQLVDQTATGIDGKIVLTGSDGIVTLTKDETKTSLPIKYYEVNYGNVKIVSFKK